MHTMSELAEVASSVASLSADEPATRLQVDGSGRLWVRPSVVAGAEAYASATHNSTSNLAAVSVPDGASKLNLFVDVTASTGTGETLDIEVEWSPDGGTTWFSAESADTFTQITAGTTKVAKQFNVLAPTYRLALTVSASSSFTFAVDHVGVYA